MANFLAWLQQSIVVEIVLTVLSLMSLASWTVIVRKWAVFRAVSRDLGARRLGLGASRDSACAPATVDDGAPSGCQAIYLAAVAEASRHRAAPGIADAAVRRIELAVAAALEQEAARLEWGLSFLATVSSASPYLGLLGTVWGIISVFDSIAGMRDLSVVAVAPGIAQALVATGAGLVAAIPAVFAYNALRARAERLAGGYESYADEVLVHVQDTMLGAEPPEQVPVAYATGGKHGPVTTGDVGR